MIIIRCKNTKLIFFITLNFSSLLFTSVFNCCNKHELPTVRHFSPFGYQVVLNFARDFTSTINAATVYRQE